MQAQRGGIRFLKPPKLDAVVAAGGLCAPVSESYPLPAREFSLRKALVDAFEQQVRRQALPLDERTAFNLKTRGFAEWGREDVSARVAEFGTREDDLDDTIYEHEWDQPIRLPYARSR